MKSLSKSQYVRGRQCVKSLWLYRHRKDLQGPVDEFQQGIFDHGTEFGQLAHQRLAGGVLIAEGHDEPDKAVMKTAVAIASGIKFIYEAAFLFEDVLVRADIIQRNIDGNWNLFEVKSSTKVTDIYLLDVAIQRHVLAGAGLQLNRCFVMHANPGYVRRGALELDRLFEITDVTEESRDALLDVPGELARMKALADAPEAPPKPIGEHCTKPYPCDFKDHCWAHVPEYSVFNLGYAKMDKKLELFNSGTREIRHITPALHTRTAGQRAPGEGARAGGARVDVKAIKKFLETLTYPLAHLDFETDNPVIPPYDGLRPYTQMPFQAVLCVQDELGAPVVEYGFLGDGMRDPRKDLMTFLLEHVPPDGSVIAYHKSFEAGRLEELAPSAGVGGSLADKFLLKMVDRLADLADPFRTNAYTHPDFKGRWSIKAVLPVLVPSMSYEGLEIGDGAAAMAAYAKLRDPKLPASERARITHALKVYCGQDVVAMVKILEHLYDVVAGKVPAGAA